jgi:hypothetical protein
MNLYKIIKEEINDFEWIENISPKYTPEVDDVVEITSVGVEDSYLKWLGAYRDKYLDGDYGTKITGRIIDISKDPHGRDIEGVFYIVETNTHDEIYLPYGNYLNVHLQDSYPGLNLLYQSVRIPK